MLALPLRLCARHVICFDAHGLAGGAFGCELGGLGAFALGGAFGDGGFFVGLGGVWLLVWSWGGGVGLRRWRHGVGMLGLGVVEEGVVVGGGHCFFDAAVVRLQRHGCFLLEGCGL